MGCSRLLLGAALLGSLGFAASAGHDWATPAAVFRSLAGDDSLQSQLLITWRYPRILAAALVGALLGLGGAIFQGVFRNPLAEPYLLGSSGGAAVGATIALLMPMGLPSQWLLAGLSFLGAWGATWLVLLVGGWRRGADAAHLLLAGVAIAAMLGAVRSFMMLALSDDTMNLQAVLSWTLGGIQTPSWWGLLLLGGLTVVALAAVMTLAHGLDLLGLGDEQAHAFGLQPERFVRWAVLIASAVVAVAVAWGGLVAFVGLIAPHVARWRCGPRHRRLLPESAAIGAILVVLCDGLARSVLPPAEIPLGLITAVFGGPFFLFVLARRRRP
ncbi:MAG: ABC transporter permease [Thiobacillus sp. 63-78]|uniref:FecCD family ABC transporter permease n=1 Tax=Thiobacillus sp. 63-78 TaxID=1895859 RepID=UPI000969CAF5|nr:iron ABC transporter permease [Thiobacillus sp. 63-78]MBN8764192.1 iron ABC transporter permease [Thiobacillus sp.]OJZ09717.1 MAG: ABC transporter permease [Thiobacillus sp. 63-78]